MANPGCLPESRDSRSMGAGSKTHLLHVSEMLINDEMRMTGLCEQILGVSTACIHLETVNNPGCWKQSCMDRPALESKRNVLSHIKNRVIYMLQTTCTGVKSVYQKIVQKTGKQFRLENVGSSISSWTLSADTCLTWKKFIDFRGNVRQHRGGPRHQHTRNVILSPA